MVNWREEKLKLPSYTFSTYTRIMSWCGQVTVTHYPDYLLLFLSNTAPRGKRGWKTFYAVLKGLILYLQKVRRLIVKQLIINLAC